MIVRPPLSSGGRPVRVRGEILGGAYSWKDLPEFVQRVGLDADMVDVADPELFEWRGGEPDMWI